MNAEIEKIIEQFSMHRSLLKQSKSDFEVKENAPLYSIDFAVLYPYIVPRNMQRNAETDHLAIVSNNIFLTLNERIKDFPFDILVPFATVLEILEHFGQQKRYLDKVSGSSTFAASVKASIVSGARSASILEDEILAKSDLYVPADDQYKCLAKLVDHLRQGRVHGYGDYFDYTEFRKYIRNEKLSAMRESLTKVRQYKQVDPADRAFHMDMDALHIAVARFFNENGTVYTGPMRTRRTFGTDQQQFSRNPKIPLVLLHAIDQSSDVVDARHGAETFFKDALSGYDKHIAKLRSVSKLDQLPNHAIRAMTNFDDVYRNEIFFDLREKGTRMTREEMASIIKSMSSGDVRHAHASASERMEESVAGLRSILNEDLDDDLMDFLSPDGLNHVENIFKSFSSRSR